MIKLNVGCGNKLLQGYINIDLHYLNVDLKWDLRNPLPYENNSVDEIYARHVIEHFTRLEWKRVKKDWYRTLKPSGVLTIECPDIIRCMERFIENKDGQRWDWWIITIYGRQEEYGKGELHKNGFEIDKLKSDLEEEGFKVIDYEYLDSETPDPEGFNIKVRAKK